MAQILQARKQKHCQSGVFHVHGRYAERGQRTSEMPSPENPSPMFDIPLYLQTLKAPNKASLQPPKVFSSSLMWFKSTLKPPHSHDRRTYPEPQCAALRQRTPVLTHSAHTQCSHTFPRAVPLPATDSGQTAFPEAIPQQMGTAPTAATFVQTSLGTEHMPSH